MRVEIYHPDRSAIIRAIRRRRAAEAERTGLHLSTIVNDIVASTMTKPDRSGIDERTGLSFQEVGNVIEDLIATGFMQRDPSWVKPEPIIYQGITCSPDGYSERQLLIDEIKVRWGSCRGFIELDDAEPDLHEPRTGELTGESETFVKYKMQLLFYMWAWGVSRGRLHVLFLNGDWRPPFPKPVTLCLRPTTAELKENAAHIIQHAIDRRWLQE